MTRRAVRSLQLAVVVALVALWAVMLRPLSLGGPAAYLVIRGDSMLPAIRTGDLVIVTSATAYGIGDVIAYPVPAGEPGAGLLVFHRIIEGDPIAGFVVQGDNNPTPDPWQPDAADIVGRLWLDIPLLGGVVTFVHRPAVAGALAVALLVVVLVRREQRRSASAKMASCSEQAVIGSRSSAVGLADSMQPDGSAATTAST